jgi:hypothetical protein
MHALSRPARKSKRNSIARRILAVERLEVRSLLSAVPVTIGPNSTIASVAGNGSTIQIGSGVYPTAAGLSNPQAVAVDSVGDVFIADQQNNIVREVNHSNGLITTIAGNGTAGYSGDNGQGTAAELNQPTGVAVYTNSQQQIFVFIADSENNRIRAVNLSSGIITTVAGNGTGSYNGDGIKATAAELEHPTGVAVDSSGDLYIADLDNARVREVNTSGFISTVAGNGTVGHSGDGGSATAATAELDGPWGVAVDSSGDIFITENSGSLNDGGCVREVAANNGDIYTVAGTVSLGPGFSGDGGAATAAQLNHPEGIAVDSAGDLFIADTGNNRIREVNYTAGIYATSNITTYAGNGVGNFAGDGGQATAAELYAPAGVALDSAGDLFIADSSSNRVREVNHSTHVISTFAGGASPGDGNQATAAELNATAAVAVDAAGDIFIADTGNNRIREVNHSTGLITTIAGNGIQGYSGDNGPATAAELNGPTGIAVNAAGNVFIADAGNNRVREINTSGVITTVAGNGTSGYNGEGTATTAELSDPTGVAVDGSGNIFIADQYNQRVRKVVLATDTISTIAGNGTGGFNGDGTATAVELNGPCAVAVDAAGDVFIAENVNNRVRELSGGKITTVAGSGDGSTNKGYSGDGGPATAAELNYPTGVAVDSSGDLFIADQTNQRIREVKAGVITTIVGNGTQGYGGDNGPASAAEMNLPAGVAVDASGDLFIADSGNNRVREVTGSGFALSGPTAGTFAAGQSVTIQWGASDVVATHITTIALGYDADATPFDANEHWIEVSQVTAANGAGSYAWNTTGLAAGTYYLSGYMYDSSTSTAIYSHLSTPITIANFAITGPTSGTFTAGQSVSIQWTVASLVAGHTVKITLGYDADATPFDANEHWIEVDGLTVANGAGSYAWNTTGVASGTYYLSGYIYDFSTSTAAYSSLSTSIVIAGVPSPTFTLSGPTSGAFTAGQSVTIGWTATSVDVAGPTKITLGYDADSTPFDANEHWFEVDGVTAANGAGSYAWNTTGVASGTYYLSGYMYDFGTSRAVYSHLGTSFVITGVAIPTFALTGPTAGTFTAGNNVTIQWTAANIDVAGPTKITLGYDADATAFDANEHWIETSQVTAANGAGSYAWNTTGVAAGTYYLAGYTYDSSTNQQLLSHITTSIVIKAGAIGLPAFTLTGPSAGTFTGGHVVTIGWSAANIDTAGPTKISLAYDPDATPFDANAHWFEVDQVTAANGVGSYAWNTTGVASGTYYLAGYTYDFTTSTAVYSHLATPFVITGGAPPTFALSGPTAGTFSAGVSVTIGWSATNVDTAGPTKISLAYDPDATPFDANAHWFEVDQLTAANGAGSYAWNTTGIASGTYYLSGYMYDFSTSTAVYSHLATSIVITGGAPPTFTLSGPTAGTFSAGVSVTIAWSATNVDTAGPSKISLAYDPDATPFDSNAHWFEIDQVTAANGAGSYAWNTTSVAAGTYYLSGYMYDFSLNKAVYSHLGTSIIIT